MNFNFEQVHNYYERLVFEEVVRAPCNTRSSPMTCLRTWRALR